MIDPALTHLMRMLMRAGFRQAWRLIKRPSGAFFTLFMLAMVGFGLMPTVVMTLTAEQQPPSAFARVVADSIPLLMYIAAAAMVATNSGEALLELKPAELQFVLAGPFTNSHILSYRLLTLAFGWLPISVFFAVFMLPHLGSFLGGLLGISSGGILITMLAFQYTLLKPRLSPGVLRAIRLAALTSVAVILIEAAGRVSGVDESYSITVVSQAINGGVAARVLSLPFRPFATVMTNDLGIELLIGQLISLGLIAAITVSCYRTNRGFSELAVEGVARRQKKLERIRGGNVYGFSTRNAERSQLLPAFGWLGGVGPVAWSQVTSAVRRTGRLVPGIVVLGIVAAIAAAAVLQLFPDTIPDTGRTYAVPIALAASAYLGFLLSITSQTGFAASPRLLTWYQTLPIRPMAIATGMVSGTATLLIAIQLALCLPALVISSQGVAASLSMLFAGAAFSVAFATMTNFIAAVTGLRPMPGGTPDVFQGARALVFMMILGLSMTPILLLAVGSAGVAGAVFGFFWTYCSIAAGLAMLAGLPALWWYAGTRFVDSDSVGDES
ncbi:putative ABC exporter domain-containing protein [Rhodopirellula sp. JC639]|uniref:putative ABC exporter domain-containing protein n=1 Tax=Stieleria mannarensis TaxID=2755585 RepID=UPI001600067D|nr:putative ABC exporter domain-containing protein [Rhodopirellula sp. JC639]